MSDPRPTREQGDLADVLELVLDKGIVINADIAVTVGETELLGIELRAAIASFETAAEYGLAFPSGTDMRRVEQASGREPLDDRDEEIAVENENDDGVDLGIEASEGGSHNPPRERPDPEVPTAESEEDAEGEDATPEDGTATDTNGDDTNDEAESERQGEGI